jgi:pyrimidine oxygenase
MDCGVFIPIANNGWIISETAPQYMPTFELNRQTCVRAEEVGFDFALSMVKFRGYGGATEQWDYVAESFTLVAALAAATTRLKLYAAVSTLTMHPAIVARMVSTISDISDGRCGVNMVSGWNKHEFTQMGLWPGDDWYSDRYEYSTEYVSVMRQLWDAGRATHAGKYFQLDDCFCQPVPRGPITVLCAGQSDRGFQYAAEVGDYNFMAGPLAELRGLRTKLDAACALTGRKVGGYALFGIVAAETDEAAVAMANHMLDGTDEVAVANLHGYNVQDTHGGSTGSVRKNRLARPTIELADDGLAAYVLGACFAIPHLVGSYGRIAQYLDQVETFAGLDGVVMTFPEFVSGVAEFGERIMPLMVTRRNVGSN